MVEQGYEGRQGDTHRQLCGLHTHGHYRHTSAETLGSAVVDDNAGSHPLPKQGQGCGGVRRNGTSHPTPFAPSLYHIRSLPGCLAVEKKVSEGGAFPSQCFLVRVANGVTAEKMVTATA